MATAWLDKPPAGSVWLVEDSLKQLVRQGIDIGGPIQQTTKGLLDQAQAVHDNERLWHRVSVEARTRLASALNSCRGFN